MYKPPPPERRCQHPGCRAWAMRGHSLCRSHRIPELGPTGGGAPQGNRNAFKHGFYSRAFTPQELREMSRIMKDEGLSLTHEIAILKLLTRRVLLSEIQPAVAYALVCRGIGQLTRSLRALKDLGEYHTIFDTAIQQALDSLAQEWDVEL